MVWYVVGRVACGGGLRELSQLRLFMLGEGEM